MGLAAGEGVARIGQSGPSLVCEPQRAASVLQNVTRAHDVIEGLIYISLARLLQDISRVPFWWENLERYSYLKGLFL